MGFVEQKYIWKKNCPKCGKEQIYTGKYAKNHLNSAKKLNSKCNSCSQIEYNIGNKNSFYGKKHTKETLEKLKLINIGKKHSEESKKKMSQNSNHYKYWLGKHFSEEHKRKIGLIGKGKKWSEKSKKKLSEIHKGKKFTNETKLKIGLKSRINQLKRMELLGIMPSEDKGAKEWFEKYNKETNSNFQSNKFIEIGYYADGYDVEKHIWIEYDTNYHKIFNRQQKDLIRQNNIIKYFEDIGNPLKAFKRVLAYDNEKIVDVI